MKNIIAVVLVSCAAAGCLSPSNPLGSPSPSAAATASTTTSNASAPDALAFGLVGPDVTRDLRATYYVNSDEPAAVSLRLDGEILASRTITGNRSWIVPLEYGRQWLNVTIASAEVERSDDRVIVRLGLTNLTVDYGVYHPSHQGTPTVDRVPLWIDVDARPSAAQYAAQDSRPIGAFTAHDQLVEFTNETGKPVVFSWSEGFKGFSVTHIDGAGNPLTATAPPYWCYDVNGASADGVSIQPVRPGDEVVWTLGTCS